MSLGKKKKNIYYIGKENKIKDLKLHLYMNVVFKNLLLLCKRSISVDKIYVHNWEGGHPDHNTSHVLGIYLAKELNILDELYQFPLYSGRNLFW